MKLIKGFFRYLYYFSSVRKFRSKGDNLIFSNHGVFIRPEEITIGSNVFISNNFHISARNLKIGNNIMIGPNVVIECDNHLYDIVGKTMFQNRDLRNVKGVTIEDDVWIGANVIILPGVTVGEGSIVGAGSVVSKNVPSYSICVGNPCRKIKNRFSEETLLEHKRILKNKCNN
jgi:acetyltransferase-like isoleucine patch superfamily enzyme